MEFGLIGETLVHSFSQEVHNRIGRYGYRLQEVAPQDLDRFLKERDFKGTNVTIPYKQSVIPSLDVISERAASVGAVNTIRNRDGKLYGDNTDFGGMQLLIERMGLELKGKKVLILGTGGTSRTARAVAEYLGAAVVCKVSRSGAEGAVTYEEAYEKHADAQILINTTPCGMYPKGDAIPVDLDRFPKLEGVVDAIYNPLRTRLVLEAEKRGIKAEGGLYMLVAQAVLAAEIFMDEKLPLEQIESIYKEIYDLKQNIVLIGMPSSGKTTVGKTLEKLTGRRVIDSDAELVVHAEMEITDIFAQFGEKWFRDLETQTIKSIAAGNGAIISTGGGVPLRQENVDALKQNGTIFFLDRPLSELLPTDDRPLANDVEKIKRLYKERYDIYCAAADHRVPVEGTPRDVAKKIIELL